MKIKGTIHLIHRLDNLWIFKYTTNQSICRVPLHHTNYDNLIDGQDIFCKLDFIQGVEVALIVS